MQIRGFFYQTDQGNLILASEPNLKSCCVGSASKRSRQILVMSDIDSNHLNQSTPVTLQGNLENDPSRAFPWHLKDAIIVNEESRNVLPFAAGAIALVALCSLAFRMKNKSPQKH